MLKFSKIKDYQYFEYESIDSTNEEAKRLWNNGQIQQHAIVTAQEQTAGKGTRGRHWVSPKGAGLYLSIIHPGSLITRNQPLPLTDLYTQAAALACVEALKETLGLSILIKPINDLYAICPQTEKPKKLGGILVEGIIQHNELKALITGIGINIQDTARPIKKSESDPEREPISLEELLPPHQTLSLSNTRSLDEFTENLTSQLNQQYQQLESEPNGERLLKQLNGYVFII